MFNKSISFILFNELKRFLGEIETDNLTVSNNEIIILNFYFIISHNLGSLSGSGLYR